MRGKGAYYPWACDLMDQVEFHVFEVTVAESRLDQYLAALVSGMPRGRVS